MMRTLLVLIAAGCARAQPTVPAVRFANAPPARAVNDRRDVPKQPAPRDFAFYLYNLDGQLIRPMTRALELRRGERARGINALDEVPNSTWFTNRIGVRDVSPEEIAAAPGGVGSPERHKPWTIVSSKVGGLSVGFIIKDARGEKFLLKFDPRGQPEAETATQIVVGKLLWAFGYNVTEDYVVNIRREDLVLAPDAVIKDVFGNKRPLVADELARRLATVDVSPDGTMRVLVSHWLAGKPLGGHAAEGVRADDPNDLIPHELRRDLRGAYAVFAWLDHVDIHEGNMLDMWVADPVDPKRHYVKHYWVDYGIALGFAARKNNNPRYGFEWYFDVGGIFRSLVTLGADDHAWEHRQPSDRRGAGLYETALYDPGAWVSTSPAYVPLYVADRIDKFWASKIMMRFTRDHITAAVAAAKLSDARTAAWLVDALIARQRATAKYWFERVNPLDEIAIDGTTLCFKDLSIAYAFAPARGTYYTLATHDRDGKRLYATRVTAGDAGITCAPLTVATTGDAYTIVRIDTTRPHFTGTTYVHVSRDATTHAMRVIGIWRP